jgi:hypothetical protein
MIQQLNIRFGKHAISVVRALSLIPRNIDQTQDDTVNEIFNYYKDDLPSPESFRHELRIWKASWNNKSDKPDNITSTPLSTIFQLYRSDLLVDETRVPRENHRPVASH